MESVSKTSHTAFELKHQQAATSDPDNVPWSLLPDHVFEVVYQFLPAPDLVSCAQLNSRHTRIIEDKMLHSEAFWRQYPHSPAPSAFSVERYTSNIRQWLHGNRREKTITRLNELAAESDTKQHLFHKALFHAISTTLKHASRWRLIEKIRAVHSDFVTTKAVAFSHNGCHLVTASKDQTANIFSFIKQDGSIDRPNFLFSGPLYRACFDDDSRGLMLASNNKAYVLTLNENDQWTDRFTFQPQNNASVRFIRISPDLRSVATVYGNHAVSISTLDEEGHAEEKHWVQHRRKVITAHFSTDSRCLVTTSEDHTARILSHDGQHHWITANVLTRNAAGVLEESDCIQHADWVYRVNFSTNNRSLVTLSRDQTACVLTLNKNNQWTEKSRIPTSETNRCPAAFFLPGSINLIIKDRNKACIFVLNKENKYEKKGEVSHTKIIHSIHCSPDGCSIVTASEDHTARILSKDEQANWRSAPIFTLNEHSELEKRDSVQHGAGVNSARFSPDGLSFVTASSDKSIYVHSFDAKKLGWVEKCRYSLEHEVQAADFSPDNCNLVAITNDRVIGNNGMITTTGSVYLFKILTDPHLLSAC